MPTSHWHGQVEVNVPFDGDVEYLINNEVVRIEKGYITLFWACTPHQDVYKRQELDWPGIAVALTLLDENARLTRENRLLQQRLARFLAHG